MLTTEELRARRRESQRRYQESHPDRVRERKRRYREANPEQHRESNRRYSEANREAIRERSRQRREADREAIRERSRQWHAANREKVRERQREYRAKVGPDALRARVIASEAKTRSIVFAHYGNACVCCGSTDQLTIDHVNGGGGDHREELFGTSRKAGMPFYRWLIRQGMPGGFQVLCAPCNTSKSVGDTCHLDHAKAEAA